VLDERVAWLISDILSDDAARQLSFGANSILKLERTAAVKTGTTNDFHDNWTVGYTPDLAVGVWVGNADNEPMRNVTGISGAGPIWHQFMRSALAGQPDATFPQPPGLVQAQVCALSGLLPSEACPYRRSEWFLAGTQPVQTDTFYKQVTLDRRTGLLADETTLPEQRAEQRVLDLPSALHPWAREEGLLLLDDLLQANGGAAKRLAETAAAEPELRLGSPDPHTPYRISPALPLAAQQLRLEAVAHAALSEVTLWLDGEPLASLDTPPYETWWPLSPGQHQAWVEGRDGRGRHLASSPISFTVLDVAEE
jgi:membrane carboxypeptidase/penicillin-binding protein PbpC